MLSDITIGQYYRADSIVHRLDARIKIIVTILFLVIIFLCKNFLSLGLMFVLVLVSVAVSKVPFKMFLKNLKPIIPIIIFTAVINVLYIKDGPALISFWKITITQKAVFTALFMMVRIICLIVSSSILTYTTSPTMLTDAIERLMSPLKIIHVPVHNLAMMMTLALRFIPTLIEEIERITNAQKARGADLENGKLMQRIKAMLPILIPLFVSAVSRAYELAYAMMCRCYKGGDGRTRMKNMKITFKDYVVIFIFAVSTVGVILLNKYFGAVI